MVGCTEAAYLDSQSSRTKGALKIGVKVGQQQHGALTQFG